MFSLRIKASNCLLVAGSSAFLAFGLYNVHSLSGVTEGGVLGMTLLLEHLFSISPSVSGFVMNALCYLAGWKLLGRSFLAYSALSSLSFSASYGVFERYDPLWPQLAQMPLAASVLGALFVGLGAGVCVRCGGATGGDDALAMSIHAASGVGVEKIYLISDLLVLALSLSYIPLERIGYSVLTVVISGQVIGLVQKIPLPKRCRKLPS